MSDAKLVYDFWFQELTPKQWFEKDANLDDEIRSRFLKIHNDASIGLCAEWRNSPTGALSEIIVLDQFSRNIYRDSASAFAFDTLALILSQEAIRRGLNAGLGASEKAFLYMPFMHSESLFIHDQAMVLYAEKGLEDNLAYEKSHRQIIERFGRYPHRNQLLGRVSTDAEIAFLNTPGSSF